MKSLLFEIDHKTHFRVGSDIKGQSTEGLYLINASENSSVPIKGKYLQCNTATVISRCHPVDTSSIIGMSYSLYRILDSVLQPLGI